MVSPSIKDCESNGPDQKRQLNWLSALQNANFKESLIRYLLNSSDSSDSTEYIRKPYEADTQMFFHLSKI